jgi:hypothetical protein
MLSELENYLDVLQIKHEEIKDILAEIGDNPTILNWKPLGDESNSIFGLVVDAALQQEYWIGHVVGQRPEPTGMDKLQEAQGQHIGPVIQLLQMTQTNTEQFFEQLTTEQLELTVDFNDEVLATRWCLLHAVQHVAENLGQLTVLWQWWQQNQNSIN